LTMNRSSSDANTPMEIIPKVRHGLVITVRSCRRQLLDETEPRATQ
jgi:hypothetical protein